MGQQMGKIKEEILNKSQFGRSWRLAQEDCDQRMQRWWGEAPGSSRLLETLDEIISNILTIKMCTINNNRNRQLKLSLLSIYVPLIMYQ